MPDPAPLGTETLDTALASSTAEPPAAHLLGLDEGKWDLGNAGM